MANFEDLDHLAAAVRAVLPDRKALTRLETIQQSNFVRAAWHGHQLAIKLSGESFELKGNDLHLTAVSRLLSHGLQTRMKLENVLAAVVESLRQSESLVTSDTKKALDLLTSIKAPLRRLVVTKPAQT